MVLSLSYRVDSSCSLLNFKLLAFLPWLLFAQSFSLSLPVVPLESLDGMQLHHNDFFQVKSSANSMAKDAATNKSIIKAGIKQKISSFASSNQVTSFVSTAYQKSISKVQCHLKKLNPQKPRLQSQLQNQRNSRRLSLYRTWKVHHQIRWPQSGCTPKSAKGA